MSMGEFAGFDLDRSTERAWSRFQARLADHLAEMDDDDVLVVSADSAVGSDAEASAPYVQFRAWGETMVRAEVSSNAYLADEVRLDEAAVQALEGLGWLAPVAGDDDLDAAPDGDADADPDGDVGSANFHLDAERAEPDRLAVMTCRVLRDVFGVPHPAFLSAGTLEEDADPRLGIPAGAGDPGKASVEASVEPPATFPRDREHLKELVDQALTPYFGSEPRHDEDDDIPVVSGSALVFVRVMEQMPTVELFSCLVHDVTDAESAAFEVAVLNRDETFLKFLLVDDAVMAYLYLPAYPFAPEQLRTMLSVMSGSVDKLDDDLAVRVGGRRTFESPPEEDEWSAEPSTSESDEDGTPEPDVDAVHPAMMTLLQLHADAPGSVTPELAASVCAMERGLVLDLITWNSRREITWRQARDAALLEGDGDEAEVCDQETTQAEHWVNLLRRALRVIVENQLGRDLENLGYGAARRPAPRAPRRDADPALPGLEDPVTDPRLFDEP
ncbi:MAG: hypothetical protein QOF53_2250 [Nocardioidaceae bacterium]|nr:hypothetical protein [Nocardioidaceae bacterium]